MIPEIESPCGECFMRPFDGYECQIHNACLAMTAYQIAKKGSQMTESVSYFDAIGMIQTELNKAIKKHPVWPKDTIYAVSIMAEEAGECVKAANDLVQQHVGSVDNLRTELAHCGAMCVRTLMNISE
jgi:hypothetical protein